MLARTETIATFAANWLAQFERALAEPDDVLLKTLFHPDSHWRDVLALTWHIRTVSGLDAILRELKAHAGRANPTGFRTDPHRTAPREVTRAGTKAIEAIFRFETAEGHGSGVLRLTPDANDGNALKAWTRVGMGPCQARVCGNLVTHLISIQAGLPVQQVRGFTPRPPIKPIPIGVMAEFAEPY